MLEGLIETVGGVGATAGNPIIFGIEVVGIILGKILGGIFSGGGTDLSQIQGQIDGLKQDMSTAVAKLTRFAWTALNALGKLLQFVHDLFVGLLAAMWELLKKLAKVIDDLIHGLLAQVVRMLAWLWNTALPAVVHAIQVVRKVLNDFYVKYMRKALVWIQLARRYLQILRLFHIKWAAKLDADLGFIVSSILGPYLQVLRYLNNFASWVNIIVNAKLILQRPVFINTMYAYQKDWVNMFWASQGQWNFPSASPVAKPSDMPESLAGVIADMNAFVTGDSGPFAAAAADAKAAFESA